MPSMILAELVNGDLIKGIGPCRLHHVGHFDVLLDA
jgi:hypothetical protein